MLERGYEQMVAGYREICKREKAGQPWTSDHLADSKHGMPLMHDILSDLGVLGRTASSPSETFEEDSQKLQERLIAQGAGFARRGSTSSESEHSGNHDYVRTPSDSRLTPFETKPNLADFDFSAPPSPPTSQSPALQQTSMFHGTHAPTSFNDPQLYQAPWAFPEQNQNPNDMLRSNSYAQMQSPRGTNMFNNMNTMPGVEQWEQGAQQQDFNMDGFQAFRPSTHFPGPVLHHNMTPQHDFVNDDYEFAA